MLVWLTVACTAALLFVGARRLSWRREDICESRERFDAIETWQSKKYSEKYEAMLHLLTGEGDFDFLAAEENYQPRIGRELRLMRRRVLRSYLKSLIADFDELYLASSIVILRTNSTMLAHELLEFRKTLKRSVRYIKFRLVVDQLMPPPRTSRTPGAVRQVALGAFAHASNVQQLISMMETIRAQLITELSP